jgi:hypothetical protein
MASLMKALGLHLFLLVICGSNKEAFEFSHDSLKGLMNKGPRGSPQKQYRMGPGLDHDLLKDTKQGGVDFKLTRST